MLLSLMLAAFVGYLRHIEALNCSAQAFQPGIDYSLRLLWCYGQASCRCMVRCWDVLKPAIWFSAVSTLQKRFADGPSRLLLGLTLMARVLMIPRVLLIPSVLLQLLADC